MLGFQQVAYFGQQYFFFAGRRFLNGCWVLFLVKAVDAFDKQKDGNGYNQEIKGGLKEVAVIECDSGDSLSCGIGGCFLENEFEVGEVDAADKKANRWHDNV